MPGLGRRALVTLLAAAVVAGCDVSNPSTISGQPGPAGPNPLRDLVAVLLGFSSAWELDWVTDFEATPAPAPPVKSDAFDPPIKYFENPTFTLFDTSNDLWVAFGGGGPSQSGNQGLLRLSPQAAASGSPKGSLFIQDDGTGKLAGPEGIGFDSHGTLWVADLGNRVLGYPASALATGGKVPPATVLTLAPATGLDQPLGLAVDAHDDVWITAGGGIAEFAAGQLTSSSTPTPARVWAVAGATGITFDRSGDLWAAVADNGAVEFTADQLGSATAPTPAATVTASEVPGARKLAISPQGDLVIVTVDSTVWFTAAHVRARDFSHPDRVSANLAGVASVAFPHPSG